MYEWVYVRRTVIIAVEHFLTVGGAAAAGVISTDAMKTSIMKKKSYRKFSLFFCRLRHHVLSWKVKIDCAKKWLWNEKNNNLLGIWTEQ